MFCHKTLIKSVKEPLASGQVSEFLFANECPQVNLRRTNHKEAAKSSFYQEEVITPLLSSTHTHIHPFVAGWLPLRRRLRDQACLTGNKPAAPPSTFIWGATERQREAPPCRHEALCLQAACVAVWVERLFRLREGGDSGLSAGMLAEDVWARNMCSKYLNARCDSRCLFHGVSTSSNKLWPLKNKRNWK